MTQTVEKVENWNHLICVDSYDQGVLQGRLYDAGREIGAFSSLSQFLIRMEHFLEQAHHPQQATGSKDPFSIESSVRRGSKATFAMQVVFRQHTSWQGLLLWQEGQVYRPFRSVLELVILIDSILQKSEGSDMA